MRLRSDDVRLLACPKCRAALHFTGTLDGDELERGTLVCEGCGSAWAVRGGLAHLVDPGAVSYRDRALRFVYDFISPSHDAAVHIVLPIIHYPDPDASRDRYVERLDLRGLAPRPRNDPIRILEVGIGGGANLPLLQHALPMHVHAEIWGVDLSPGMLLQCRLRLLWWRPGRPIRLMYADAHALPFQDATFDRVFHVGAINGYGDARTALDEMARVARPGTPIVVVDEGLDPNRSHSLYHRIAFRLLTAYDAHPHPPVDLLPSNAIDVEVTAASRFYYCLRFRMPGP